MQAAKNLALPPLQTLQTCSCLGTGSFLLLPSRCNLSLVHTELQFLIYKCSPQGR